MSGIVKLNPGAQWPNKGVSNCRLEMTNTVGRGSITYTLQSAVAQTWPHKEIIVVDDWIDGSDNRNRAAILPKSGRSPFLGESRPLCKRVPTEQLPCVSLRRLDALQQGKHEKASARHSVPGGKSPPEGSTGGAVAFASRGTCTSEYWRCGVGNCLR
jgi:hypothetical protein